ncbi:DUF6918 family protein [Nakamurella lactea]|uniref:DUF6918 family protein n=1 Tax=Nakamurella lactea TaxID=459515 RepID=UPI00041A7C7E|nr:hypothetical protein [Nakamurella lactea]
MTLTEALLAEQRRPAVVADLVAVIDAEVKGKKGVSGAAIKAGYATVKKVSPNITTSATNRMLPDFATVLEPFWTDFGGAGDFGSYLAGRGDEAADALLTVTDNRVGKSGRKTVQKAYNGLRGRAKENVKAALPRIGAVLQQHAG